MADELIAGYPISVQREIINWYYWRGGIMDFLGFVLASRIGEIRATREAEISLRRSAAAYRRVHIGVCIRRKRKSSGGEIQIRLGFLQQFTNCEFSLAIITLADMHIGDAAVLIDQKIGGPCSVVKGVPDRLIIV